MSLAQFLDGTILDPKNIESKVYLPKGITKPFTKINYFGNTKQGNAVKKINPYDIRQSSTMTYADLINAESALGRTIFGPIPEGHQREFCLSKKNIWVWYDGWFDEKGEPQGVTIRYEVRPDGVFKFYNGKYIKLKGTELNNFCEAVRTYHKLVKTHLYF
jgi:hypothetical protein